MPAIRLLDLENFAALSPTKQFFNGLLMVTFPYGAIPNRCLSESRTPTINTHDEKMDKN